jgi:hypothetical protein
LVQNTTTFGGGITNSGTISADLFAIWLSGVSTFAGGISNRGVISGGVGILLSQLSTFAGGSGSGGAIVNSGKITGTFDGIRVVLVDTFAGGIVNSKGGTITVKSAAGIFVSDVSIFDGSVANTGTISSDFGAIKALDVTVFSGDIENDGTLATAFNGVLLEDIKTFVGDINNKGTISAG